jgi:hypothetical protein
MTVTVYLAVIISSSSLLILCRLHVYVLAVMYSRVHSSASPKLGGLYTYRSFIVAVR